MYHIKADKRCKNSSELLYQSLSKLMKEIPFDKITVLELSKISTISRATIYRNFDTIADILYWKCNQQFEYMLTAYVSDEHRNNENDDFLFHIFNFWNQHSDILEQLIAIGRIDIIFTCFRENSHIIIDYMKVSLSLSETELEYFISIRLGIFIAVISTWISLGKKESTEELVQMIVSQIQDAKHMKVYY